MLNNMNRNIIYTSDCKTGLKTLPDNSVDCCVTSPPYFGLRDYGEDAQIGLEPTPEEYIAQLVEVFTEVRRVLKLTGTLWINIGDSYAGSGRGVGGCHKPFKSNEIKPKDLIGIPWMLAFALRQAGWYLRQDIIWHKPNAMPESVTDRCAKAHEYIFLLSKSAKYHFDFNAIKEPAKTHENRPSGVVRNREYEYQSKPNLNPEAYRIGHKKRQYLAPNDPSFRKNTDRIFLPTDAETVNKRSVWDVPTKPFKGAHFATFPSTLIVDCIKAGCPTGGLVLDPFMGSGTTAIVARKLGRDYIGFELNPEYVEISNQRIAKELGLFQ